MDFSLSEEQQMIVEMLGRFVEKDYPFETRRALVRSARGFSEDNWRTFAGLGLLGLIVPEEYGGMGGDAADTMLVMEQLGRGLVLEPFLSSAVLGAGLIADAGTKAHKEALLPGLVEGGRRLALAALEPGARFDLRHVATRVRSRGTEGFVIDGCKAVVHDGGSADTLIVTARSSGEIGDREGTCLLLVDASTPGVDVRAFTSIDGGRTAEISFANVRVDAAALIADGPVACELLDKTVDRGIAGLCAEAVGAMDRLVEISCEHLRTRTQFGQPIGRFQALQHRIADMLIATEQARAMAFCAAAGMAGDDVRARRRAVSAAKSMIGRSGRFVAQQAIQLHGGMGMTDECAVGHFCKRLNCIDVSWGNSDHHLESYAALM